MEHLGPGTPVSVTEIDMIDSNTGWALGGTPGSDPHVLQTRDGGQTWRDVTPPQFRTGSDAPGRRRLLPGWSNCLGGVSPFLRKATEFIVWRTRAGATWSRPTWPP
jgi:hypothetical protein